MKRLRVFPLLPGWDASPSQGYHPVKVTSLRFVCYFPPPRLTFIINSWTTGLGAHLPLSFTHSMSGGALTPPQAYKYIYLGVACATLVCSSLNSGCGAQECRSAPLHPVRCTFMATPSIEILIFFSKEGYPETLLQARTPKTLESILLEPKLPPTFI